MRPRLATVLSGRGWEPQLVSASRKTGQLRVVGRAYNPEDLDRFGTVDCIAVGSETAWLNPDLIGHWKRRGSRVIGIHPLRDEPSQRLFSEADADLVLPDTVDATELVHRINLLSLDPSPVSTHSQVVAVTGTQGAPGRTSVAVSLALALEDSFLIDGEHLPGVGPLFSLGPGLEHLDIGHHQLRFNHPASAQPSIGPPRLAATIGASRLSYSSVLVDLGVLEPTEPQLRSSDVIILVVDASTTGLIRASRALERWTLSQPTIVLNKVGDPSDVQSCRYATGIEPTAIIPRLSSSNPLVLAEEMATHLQGIVQGLAASR